MTGLGYVSLAVDSFATRGIKDACTRPIPGLMLPAKVMPWALYPIFPNFLSSILNVSLSLDHRRVEWLRCS